MDIVDTWLGVTAVETPNGKDVVVGAIVEQKEDQKVEAVKDYALLLAPEVHSVSMLGLLILDLPSLFDGRYFGFDCLERSSHCWSCSDLELVVVDQDDDFELMDFGSGMIPRSSQELIQSDHLTHLPTNQDSVLKESK